MEFSATLLLMMIFAAKVAVGESERFDQAVLHLLNSSGEYSGESRD